MNGYIDAAGDLFIADGEHQVVREVTPDGIITTLAEQIRKHGSSGDGGPAVLALLSTPHGLAVNAAGDLYIADTTNRALRKVEGPLIVDVG